MPDLKNRYSDITCDYDYNDDDDDTEEWLDVHKIIENWIFIQISWSKVV